MYELAKEIALNLSLGKGYEDEYLGELVCNVLDSLTTRKYRVYVIEALEECGSEGADALIEKVRNL